MNIKYIQEAASSTPPPGGGGMSYEELSDVRGSDSVLSNLRLRPRFTAFTLANIHSQQYLTTFN